MAALSASATAAEPGSGTGGTAPPPPAEQAGDMPVDAPRWAFVHERVAVRGRARRARMRVVRIDRRRAGGTWATFRRVRADRDGRFAAVWRPQRAGAYELRARVGGGAASGNGGTPVPLAVGTGTSAAASSQLAVYEPAIATWYGPGLFGNQTACGIVLTEWTVGVAHRELPCGTRVQLAYRDRAIVVPVIDRGPYAHGADWDLTQAAAQQLGMTATSRIGAMQLSPSG